MASADLHAGLVDAPEPHGIGSCAELCEPMAEVTKDGTIYRVWGKLLSHQRALERSANAYQHLYMLVERALAVGTQKTEHFVIHSDLGTPATTANTAASTAISLATTPAPKTDDGTGDFDQKDLYRRLRALSLALSGESEA
ncbi:unnamed protein product [Symbiodinium natans]|uniref:Uncharacterized protein n=1 Tax=Symbiodinium natans TaxID=878477 RepID=A0A812NGX1_9DINO|nr:unnamed protein product [Symbiodinium natans]